ncbi:uncharacterized protein LOC133299986 [Gastrolobium bilobum]|uniref:uncharacterized protein LOC133299986 n=1 Tax=Gastrolobium bilobum TaxID=150636 RepID=UPI002AB034A3|nr:uncharacterized protein LOC133299986 [Gastrolobium bilobum]
MCTPDATCSEDWLKWRNLVSGKSVVKNAYCLLLNSKYDRDKIWAAVWQWKGPFRMAVFLWLACLNKLPVRSITSLWSAGEILCPTCAAGHESLMHLLRDCTAARRIWEIWFDVYKILCYLKEMRRRRNGEANAVDDNQYLILKGTGQEDSSCKVRIYVDGAVSLASKKGACGDFACSVNGEWLSGFSYSIGVKNFELAARLNLSKVLMGSDREEAISCLEDESEIYSFSSLIADIRKAANSFELVQVEYIPRERIALADLLAKTGLYFKGGECCDISRTAPASQTIIEQTKWSIDKV